MTNGIRTARQLRHPPIRCARSENDKDNDQDRVEKDKGAVGYLLESKAHCDTLTETTVAEHGPFSYHNTIVVVVATITQFANAWLCSIRYTPGGVGCCTAKPVSYSYWQDLY